jgi:hypothetical protein
LRDPTGTLDAAAAARSTGWQPSRTHHPNFGWTRDVIWLRLMVHHEGPRPMEAILDGTREWVEEVDLYELDGGAVRSMMHSGSRVPAAARPVEFERIVFPLSLAPGESRTLLVRMHSRSPIAFAGRIFEHHAFVVERAPDEILYGAYYGVLLGLAAYSLILFWRMRDPTQLIVGLILFFYMLGECTSHGHASRFIPRLAGWLELGGGAGTLGAAAILMMMLAQRLSGARGALRRVVRAMVWVVATASGAATVSVSLHVVAFAAFAAFGALMVVTIILIQEQDPKRLYFGTAVGAFMVPTTIQLFMFFGLVDSWPENANHLGAVAMAVLFSLLVGHTVFEQNQHISSLNVELRRQIGDRARQLSEALARLSSAPPTLDAGALVADRYRIVGRLGMGGMGIVYEVARTSDGKRFALKMVKGVSDRDALVRFAREAQIMAELDHPNIVSVLDVDVSQNGSLFLVMDLVPGATLLAHKERWGDFRWARPILGQIASALVAMHARGVVHRDLKPANVLLDGERVKVSDFGIARLRRDDPGESTVTRDLTRTGAFLGTPRYAAPELLKGVREAQPACDLWSFGVMAEELLGEISHEKLRSLVRACLSEDPNARPSAQEIARAFV